MALVVVDWRCWYLNNAIALALLQGKSQQTESLGKTLNAVSAKCISVRYKEAHVYQLQSLHT